MVNIVIGGDVCPVGRNLSLFRDGNVSALFNDLLNDFVNSDLAIVNLECPLIEINTPTFKYGRTLGVESTCVNGLKNAKIDVLNLANNHILDHGSIGLENTLKVSAENSILTVGAGKNLMAAREIIISEIANIKIVILGVTEHEFSIAKHDSHGANPLDLVDFVWNLRENRSGFDYLIALLHGGNETYQYPSPCLQDTCRFMIKMGAGFVVVQHTHCPGCYEEYQNGHIIYGQGNLIFDAPERHESFYEGFVVKLSILENLQSKIGFIPYRQSDYYPGARRMKKSEEDAFFKRFKK